MLPVLLLAGNLLAAANGYYHPDDVARVSAVFGRASAASTRAFDAAQADLDRASVALVALDRHAALLGGRAPEGFTAYALSMRRDGAAGRASVQSFVDGLAGGFEAAFSSALVRALAGVAGGQPSVECHPGGAGPSGGPAIPGRTRCPGRDLNVDLARAMDADPVLLAEVDRLLASPWPGFALQGTAQPVIPLTGSATFLRMDEVIRAFVAAEMAAIEAADRAAREPLFADLEEGDETSRLRALADARALRARYDASMAVLGGRLLDALTDALPRIRGVPPALGLCANPARLGGCPGQDVTDSVLPLLQADRRLQKAFE